MENRQSPDGSHDTVQQAVTQSSAPASVSILLHSSSAEQSSVSQQQAKSTSFETPVLCRPCESTRITYKSPRSNADYFCLLPPVMMKNQILSVNLDCFRSMRAEQSGADCDDYKIQEIGKVSCWHSLRSSRKYGTFAFKMIT